MLTKLWRFLFGGCEHKWVIFGSVRVFRSDPVSGAPDNDKPVGTKYHVQCERCGEVTSRIV